VTDYHAGVIDMRSYYQCTRVCSFSLVFCTFFVCIFLNLDLLRLVFTVQCTIVQSIALQLHVICLSVCPSAFLFVIFLVILNQIGSIGASTGKIAWKDLFL